MSRTANLTCRHPGPRVPTRSRPTLRRASSRSTRSPSIRNIGLSCAPGSCVRLLAPVSSRGRHRSCARLFILVPTLPARSEEVQSVSAALPWGSSVPAPADPRRVRSAQAILSTLAAGRGSVKGWPVNRCSWRGGHRSATQGAPRPPLGTLSSTQAEDSEGLLSRARRSQLFLLPLPARPARREGGRPLAQGPLPEAQRPRTCVGRTSSAVQCRLGHPNRRRRP